MNTYHNNPKKSSKTKINKYTFWLFIVYTFDTTKNKLDYSRGKNYMKKGCLDLREHARKIIDYERKEMISLTYEEKKIHREQKFVIYAK